MIGKTNSTNKTNGKIKMKTISKSELLQEKRILDDDVVISEDNIQRIGEIIAITIIKTIMCRSSRRILLSKVF